MKYPYICDITLKRLTMKRLRLGPVSYTHLTLPTTSRV